MKKAYILVYSDLFGTREEIKKFLNSMIEVTHWRYDLPNCFYIISASDAKSLSTIIKQLGGNDGLFIIAELNVNVYGWLTEGSWYLIENKCYIPEKE